uniref:Putative capsid protein n=1 Tax=viral metagenome TaxID=1070528 RepID=A0A6H1ZV02_9ZZZZ
MSTQVTTSFVKQYAKTVFTLAQQEKSRLRPAVRVDTGIVGTGKYYDRIGTKTMQAMTSRHGDTPQNDTPHSRRHLPILWYNDADMMDTADSLAMLIDPKSDYIDAQAYAAGRRIDQTIIDALGGTAATGVAGAGSQALSTAQKIAHASAGLNFSKVRNAKDVLDAAEVPDEDRYFVVTSYQMNQDLLGIEQATSADYVVKALQKGEIPFWMGFKWIRSELLTTTSSITYCYAFQKRGLQLGFAKDTRAIVGQRPDKNYSWQGYTELGLGAVRMAEEFVVQVACYEA